MEGGLQARLNLARPEGMRTQVWAESDGTLVSAPAASDGPEARVSSLPRKMIANTEPRLFGLLARLTEKCARVLNPGEVGVKSFLSTKGH